MCIDDEESVNNQEIESSEKAEPEAPLSATKKKKTNDEEQCSVSIDPQCRCVEYKSQTSQNSLHVTAYLCSFTGNLCIMISPCSGGY